MNIAVSPIELVTVEVQVAVPVVLFKTFGHGQSSYVPFGVLGERLTAAALLTGAVHVVVKVAASV
jgi:hypothetical protein